MSGDSQYQKIYNFLLLICKLYNLNQTQAASSPKGSSGPSYDIGLVTENYLAIFGAPLLVVIGTIGNFLNLFMVGRVCPGTTMGIIISAIAIGNFITIWTTTATIVSFVDFVFKYKIKNASDIACKGFAFFSIAAGDFAIWMIIIATLDRMLVVLFPLKVKNWKMKRNVKILILATIILTLVKNTHLWISRGVAKNKCTRVALFEYEYNYRFWVALFTVALTPQIVVAIFNVLSLSGLKQHQKRMMKMSESEAGSKQKQKSTAQNNALLITLVTSIAFSILTTPLFVFMVTTAIDRTFGDTPIGHAIDVSTVFLLNIHHSVDFYLYMIFSAAFRKKVVAALHCKFS